MLIFIVNHGMGKPGYVPQLSKVKLLNIFSFLALSFMLWLRDYYQNYCVSPASIKQWIIKHIDGGGGGGGV
jgi:hypothetical protein